MAKLTKEELIAKIDATGLSEEEKISFMEDISDSFEVSDTTELDNAKAELDNVKAELDAKITEYDELLAKYKERFLSNEDVKVEVDEEEKVEPEMEEKEYVDVKDIFTEEKEEED